MTVDVDVYDSEGEKVDIDILPGENISLSSTPLVVPIFHSQETPQ